MNEPSLIPADWNVPPTFRRRLGTRVGRQRAMCEKGHLLLVLHAPPEPGEAERRPRLFWRRPDGTWSSTGPGDGAGSLARHLDDWAAAIERLDDEEAAASGPQAYFELMRKVLPIHRAAGNLYATLQQARQMLPEARDLIDVRDRAYQLNRSAELLHTMARDGLDFEVARHSERLADHGFRMSVAAHRLNLLAAFFFPVATLSSIFGMNLKHGLEQAAWPEPFLAVLGGGLLAGALLTVVIARRPRPVQPLPAQRAPRRTSGTA